ncbi:hypothetical protein HRI_002957300 [Hibiscus trionum]|uniref:Response regulatory domain-containing protein n=1 Tax=Hibiscus trionum TaxID=183268 RepID=A0A9W7IAL7_HIBTR|nr:hypothetical protein HRI_002957300 [Hibiscus trionum]
MEENFINKHIQSQIDDNLTVKELRVLACDANFDSLLHLCAALVNCKFKVKDAKSAGEAVEILNANKHGFDLVFVDVDTDSSDAFKLLETIGHEMQIPVIMVTGDSSPENKTKALSHGALDCIRKCPKEEEIMNTIRYNFTHNRHQNQKPLRRLSNPLTEDARSDKYGKKKRMVWTPELDAKFVNTVQTLDKTSEAQPMKILDRMNEPGLTRDKVASHLQKYRMALKKRKAAEMNEQGFQFEDTSSRRKLEIDNINADSRLTVPSFSGVHSSSDGNSSLGTLMPWSSSSPVPSFSGVHSLSDGSSSLGTLMPWSSSSPVPSFSGVHSLSDGSSSLGTLMPWSSSSPVPSFSGVHSLSDGSSSLGTLMPWSSSSPVPSFSGVHSLSDGSSSLGTLMPWSSSSPVPKEPFQSHGFQTSDVYDNYLLETNAEPHNLEAETTSQSAPYLHGEGLETIVPSSRWFYGTPNIYSTLPDVNAAFYPPPAVSLVLNAAFNPPPAVSSVPNHVYGITNNVQYPADSTVLAVNGVTEPVWNGTSGYNYDYEEVSEVDNNQINYSLSEESFEWRSLLNADYFSGI